MAGFAEIKFIDLFGLC